MCSWCKTILKSLMRDHLQGFHFLGRHKILGWFWNGHELNPQALVEDQEITRPCTSVTLTVEYCVPRVGVACISKQNESWVLEHYEIVRVLINAYDFHYFKCTLRSRYLKLYPTCWNLPNLPIEKRRQQLKVSSIHTFWSIQSLYNVANPYQASCWLHMFWDGRRYTIPFKFGD